MKHTSCSGLAPMFHGKIWTHATKIRNTTESVAAKTRASIKRALASMSLPEIADSRGQRKNTAILGGLIPFFFVHLDTFLLTLVPQSVFFLHLPTLLYSLALQGIEPLERAKKNLLTAPHYSPDLVTHGVFHGMVCSHHCRGRITVPTARGPIPEGLNCGGIMSLAPKLRLNGVPRLGSTFILMADLDMMNITR